MKNSRDPKFSHHRLVQRSSGFFSVEPRINTNELAGFYADSYFQHSLSTYSAEYSLAELTSLKNEHRLRYLAYVLAGGVESGSFLDVGCGEGFEMRFMAEAGWSVKGMDFSDEGMKNHNRHLLSRLTVGPINDSLDALLGLGEEFDCIYLGNVLEHVPDPESLLIRVLKLLSKNGLVIVRVPNDFSPLQTSLIEESKVRDSYWVSIPEHLNYFNLKSLTQFLSASGLTGLDYFSSFPIDWYIANESSNYLERPEIGKSAHRGRIFIDEVIFKNNNLEDALRFYRGLCLVGMGRNITVVAKAK